MKQSLSFFLRPARGRHAQLPSLSPSSAQPVASTRPGSFARRSRSWEPLARIKDISQERYLRAAPLLAVSEPTLTAIGVAPPWMLLAGTLVGLPVALWTYKCLMMIIFQRSIIYMGAWPPGARTMSVDTADPLLRGLNVEDVAIHGGEPSITLRGVALRRSRNTQASDTSVAVSAERSNDPLTILVYFQGNMGSCVGRLPLFAHLLSSPLSPFSDGRTVLLAICPRSYYLSSNTRPTQAGLTRDYGAILSYAQRTYPTSRIIVYGHSLGGTGACCLLASIPVRRDCDEAKNANLDIDDLGLLSPPHALILENPFPSVPAMIERSLYRSRWLPYHFLSPFVLDVWDALDALSRASGTLLSKTPILFVSGENDSLVLPLLVREMYEAAQTEVEGEVEKELSGVEGFKRPLAKGVNGAPVRRWLSIPNVHHDNTAAGAMGPWGRGVRSFLTEVERSTEQDRDASLEHSEIS